ncbi:hypothetical protein [Shewanella xiamenensis]|uniref:hypothetical protein n=1 Tax=Shewanella xiamenensis TaxID=332186 RepID=UPI001F064950|nr:hypothetical protein [Shewanella xiamenensis]UML92563.1 hypothetical protein MKD32_14085 [Shewanella xiamenensis]
MKEIQKAILAECAARWFKNPAGITASELAHQFGISNEEACKEVESLCDAGYGKMNRDAEFTQRSFDTENPKAGFTQTPLRTHAFFPSKQVLADAYYSSELPRQKLPEYIIRLHLGAHQYGLVYFNEEVLSRYFDHPEFYEIEDSLSGGSITSCSGASEDRHLYVRYGKCRLHSGHISISAVYKDLAHMGSSEQHYWHAHEINDPSIDPSDENFQIFLSRTYEGAWVEYPDPIGDLLTEVAGVNLDTKPLALFARTENVHLRMPVEQTYKSYCDCASELYKVVGPDALSQPTIKALLQDRFAKSQENFIHSESKRPLSSLQLLELLESELGVPNALRGPLKKVAQLRVDADHKILSPQAESRSYSSDFANLCFELKNGIAKIRTALAS